MTPELRAACEFAVHVVTSQGRVIRAGRAVMYVLHTLGFRWLPWILMHRPFIWFVEIGYWLVARNRKHLANFWSLAKEEELKK